MHLRALQREAADVIAQRVTEALRALGVQPTGLHLEEVLAGLLIVARVGDRPGACLVPHGRQVLWADVAKTLVGDLGGPDVLAIAAQKEQAGHGESTERRG